MFHPVLFKIVISDLDEMFQRKLEVLPKILDGGQEAKRAWQVEVLTAINKMKWM